MSQETPAIRSLQPALRRALLLAIAVSGLTAMLAQILLIRELLVVFDGLEICIGVMLASWMLLVALGSWLAGRLAGPLRLGGGALMVSQWLAAGLIPAAVLGARLLKGALGLEVYDLVDFTTLTWLTLALLAPLCLLVGFQFALACHLLATRKEGAEVELGRVYLYETLGALGGGLVFSFVLVFLWGPLPIAWLASLFSLIAAGVVGWFTCGVRRTLPPPGPAEAETSALQNGAEAEASALQNGAEAEASALPRRGWPTWRGAVLLVGQFLVSAAWIVAVVRSPVLEQAVWRRHWGEFQLVETHYSRYGHLAVTEQAEQYTFYENGLRLFSLPALMTPEVLAHYPLLEHPHPREVLLIGGGVSGLVREVLRHDVQRVCYVELDPQIIATAEPYLSPEDRQALADPRVEVHENLDGRLFVKRERQPFDVILVCLPDPSTAQLNRFYTVEFCREARQALKAEGILALSLSSGENYLSPETQLLNACLDRTLRQSFAEVVVLPGDSALFLACAAPGVLTSDPGVLAARFRERALTPQYLTEYDFLLRMTPERMEWLREQLGKARNVKLNRDFFPICYYYDWLRWEAQFSQRDEASARRGEWFLALANDLRFWWLGLPLVLVALGRLLSAIRNPQSAIRNRRMVAWTLFCSGFGGIALEMLLVFAFQSLYGYVYYQVGLLITAFMLGLLLGAYRMNRLLEGPKVVAANPGGLPAPTYSDHGSRITDHGSSLTTLARLQLALTLYALLLPLVLWILAHFTHQTLLFLVVQVIFPALVVGAGGLVGAQFPLASHICLQENDTTAGRTGGTLYAADLLGACGGAFLVSALLLPLLGVAQTCFGTALLLVSAVAGLWGRDT